MNIINNLSADNHYVKITKLLKESADITIASPFLMRDYTEFLNTNQIKKGAHIKIITNLKANSIEQINNIQSLTSFVNHPKISEDNITVSVSINNRLHGKVYIFNDLDCAIISSANFTTNGLERNHEWGIQITEKETIKQILQDLEGTIEKRNLTLIDINNLYEAAQNFTEYEKIPSQKIKLDLIGLLPTTEYIGNLPTTSNYWLKPVGVTENPIPIGRTFSRLTQRLNFSKRRPNSVGIGDLLICYGVGSKQILSIYRVSTLPTMITQEELEKESWLERWPWHVTGENLTPNYGNEWWKHGLNPFRLVETFKQKYPNIPITSAGGYTLGAINQGQDKLNLSKEFAEFMINQVILLN